MKTLYLECAMGAAGDMLSAALWELCPDKEEFARLLQGAGIPGVEFAFEPAMKCGVKGTRFSVRVNGEEEHSEDVHPHEHEHTHEHEHEHIHDHEHEHIHDHEHEHPHFSYENISRLISGLALPEEVKQDAEAVYRLIGEAESEVHGVPMEQIHFHELGSMDAVADVVTVCLLLHMLAPDRIAASPVHVGSGFVRCAHGILPVPAPAAALLLEGVPTYGGSVRGELCTPTGAALLKYFVSSFGDRPVMTVKKIGYGMGQKDFEAANCVRAFWGETEDSSPEEPTDEIVEITCNLDDMTPEAIGYACGLLLKKGALDVFTTPITMKKSRPAVQLTVLCPPERSREFGRLILANTTTIGVRMKRCSRMILRSEWNQVHTDFGPLRVKVSRGYGISRYKPEFEDVKRIAEQSDVSFDEIISRADEAVSK